MTLTDDAALWELEHYGGFYSPPRDPMARAMILTGNALAMLRVRGEYVRGVIELEQFERETEALLRQRHWLMGNARP